MSGMTHSPCPSCGGTEPYGSAGHILPDDVWDAEAICGNCHLSLPEQSFWYPTEEEAIEAALKLWNKTFKPKFEVCGRAHIRLEDDGLDARLEVTDGTHLQPEDSPVEIYVRVK